MSVSVFDLFKIGIGPSSSHTVGPMRAAARFAKAAMSLEQCALIGRVKAELYGSLGATGKGHGSDRAIMLGLEDLAPDTIEPNSIEARVAAITVNRTLLLAARQTVAFDVRQDLLFFRKSLPFHPNGMRFLALDAAGSVMFEQTYFSIGGGFVVEEGEPIGSETSGSQLPEPFPFHSGDELLDQCLRHHLSISDLMMANEAVRCSADRVRERLLQIWQVMQDCVTAGCHSPGLMPGGLKIAKRAPQLFQQLTRSPIASLEDPLAVLDWVNLYALAVNEQNACGGRVVTAPTNGAAGIVPAVLHYYVRFVPGANDEGVVRFLLTAAAIGILYKENASISGAEVGCQGEVGVACSMAAAALAEVQGGTPGQVENAAEIGMEHNLGLTCDPVGGLVQVPCIERNAMGSVKAINAARIALKGDGTHFVSLDDVIKTMRDTGADMKLKYKETSRGGLALNASFVPVNVIEC